ncbi:MAG: arylsulfatase [Akkermansiaceae bacterium]
MRHQHNKTTPLALARLFSALLVIAPVSLLAEDTKKPNIMIIMVDDMGYSDIGCYGGEIKTPNIDRLAADGLRYSQFYNCARCWPTRASLLTGYYPQAINRDSVLDIKGGGRNKRPKWAKLLPRYLKNVGYRSYHSGKWHIDGKPVQGGFDKSYHMRQQDRFFSKSAVAPVYKEFPELRQGKKAYTTSAIADHAIGVLKDHHQNHSNKAFFSYVAFTAPHFPLHALPEDIKRVGDRYRVGWDKIREQRWQRIKKLGLVKAAELSTVEQDLGPPYHFEKALKTLGDGEINLPIPWTDLTEKQKKFQQKKMTLHAAMIERVDIEIGRIIEQVKAMGALEDTLIVFLSDNGASAEIMVRGDGHDPNASLGSKDTYLCLGPGWSTTCNTPFRKHKTWTHEGGSCTPLIVYYPKMITTPGEIRRTPGHVIDIVPTVIWLAGVRFSDRVIPFPGDFLTKSFKQDITTNRTLWWSHEGHHAIRSGEWKLVKSKGGEWELYNLNKDRTETTNLADKYPEKVSSLKKKWQSQVQKFREIKK